ncbi:MAG: ABC transporter permease subunit [Actinobacteria bacterium]|nr:ABC transporter permease subunit [Actinomycetota bacterium]
MRITLSTETRGPTWQLPKGTRKSNTALNDGGTPSLFGTVVKIVLLGLMSAAMVFAIMILIGNEDYLFAGIVAVATLLVNWVYLRRGSLPAKYLAPGLIFMAVFQVYVVGYSGYIAFTNYGSMHNSDKDDAINALLLNGQTRIAGEPVYPLTVVTDDAGELNFLVTITDESGATQVKVAADGEVLQQVTPTEFNSFGAAKAAEGYTEMPFREIAAIQEEVVRAKLYLSDDPESYFLMTPDASQADTMTRVEDGKVFTDSGEGIYRSTDGEELAPGWRVEVGLLNFERAITDPGIREPLLRVTIWTFAFAILSMISTFILGLGLALLFNDAKLRGQRWYRVAMVLPYAFPGFLSAFVWRALYNKDYGFINVVLFGGAEIPWLTDEFLVKISILLVNLWLGFPYMFLITTGALQSIPSDLMESARIDGASAWQQLRLIKLPLLLVSVAPLLITSFAFNFNNFSLIYLLSGGGPKDFDATINVGHSDILISMVYKIAFSTGEGRDFGLASAFSILIFFIVGTISYFSFRRTKTLEDVN